eukprot:TRINITY_DN26626_c0_g1_i1.p1 TRINITY_DN26626_c0_g1~~TRINITY_DN26626_c0_g1_i1.p1  ORF type:complete len:713 (+),score=167.58 TRINITY_DN26626_c0_g1_i1:234-2372(+)
MGKRKLSAYTRNQGDEKGRKTDMAVELTGSREKPTEGKRTRNSGLTADGRNTKGAARERGTALRDQATEHVQGAAEATRNAVGQDYSMLGGGPMDQILEGVVKVFVTSTSPNYAMPWQMKHQSKATASGFAIHGRRILTNAHAVAHHTLVMVRKHGNPKKYTAKVEAVGQDCDIAMLTVEDGDFWEGIRPLELSAAIPQMQDEVHVVGYPTGGDNVSVTKGVVSRLEMQHYSHASCSLLAIQIDAAINSGNSGGPALRDDQVIGIAFETLEAAENIGYIIPVLVIEHFLEDIRRNGHYTGFCEIGVLWQNLENVALREYYSMSKEHTGVLVIKVMPLSLAKGILEPDDVILAFDGAAIADDGTVPFRGAERIEFGHLVAQKYQGDECRLRLLRKGKVVEVSVQLSINRPLIPIHLLDLKGPPGYFIFAGLVFVQASQPYLRAQWGKDWDNKAPYGLCEKAGSGIREFEGQEVVLLSQVLGAEITNGYQSLSSLMVRRCNGESVKNLRHLAQLVEGNTDPFVSVELEREQKLVVKVETAKALSAEILEQNFIPAPYPNGFLSEEWHEAVGPAVAVDNNADKALTPHAGRKRGTPGKVTPSQNGVGKRKTAAPASRSRMTPGSGRPRKEKMTGEEGERSRGRGKVVSARKVQAGGRGRGGSKKAKGGRGAKVDAGGSSEGAVKRGRGRPRKEVSGGASEGAIKRGRGRPRKDGS